MGADAVALLELGLVGGIVAAGGTFIVRGLIARKGIKGSRRIKRPARYWTPTGTMPASREDKGPTVNKWVD